MSKMSSSRLYVLMGFVNDRKESESFESELAERVAQKAVGKPSLRCQIQQISTELEQFYVVVPSKVEVAELQLGSK